MTSSTGPRQADTQKIGTEWIESILDPSENRALPLQENLPEVDVRSFLSSLPDRVRDSPDPFELAVVGASHADRVSLATVCGHQAATRRLVPGLSSRDVTAFCASEEGGAHPKFIKTSLSGDSDALVVSGQKRWATLSPVADRLLVVASVGWQDGRNRLKVVNIPATRDGISVRPMPPTEFTPEITHAEIELDEVEVEASDVLPGDGYLDAVKPFRTIEDVLIAASVVAYNLRLATRWSWPEEAREELLLLLVAARELTRQDPSSAAHHLAVAGWNRISSRVREDHRAQGLWQSVPPEIDQAFVRDTKKSVAERAKELRRQAAWRAVTG